MMLHDVCIDVENLYLTYFQAIYQMRPHCNVRESYFDKWCENIRAIGLSKDDEETMLVYACLAFKQPLKKRLFYLNKMEDFIHTIASIEKKRQLGMRRNERP